MNLGVVVVVDLDRDGDVNLVDIALTVPWASTLAAYLHVAVAVKVHDYDYDYDPRCPSPVSNLRAGGARPSSTR